MKSEWNKVKLVDVTSKIGSGSTPRGGSSVYLDSGEFALFRSQNVLNNSFSSSGLVYIDEQAAKKLKNVSIEENDVLLNITGDSVARVCKVPSEYLPARVNQHVAIIRTEPTKLDSSYLNYYLNNDEMQKHMLSLASAGATRNALTKAMIEDFEISTPSLPIQKKIAHILSTLDDKIELNRKMNQTLEEMSQAIFKSWFVDFDPVHAKAKCSSEVELEAVAIELGISKEVLELFPSEFEESELRMIPKGWTILLLKDILDFQRGVEPGSKNYIENPSKHDIDKDDLVQFFRVKDLATKGNIYITRDLSNNKLVRYGEVLVTFDGTVGRVNSFLEGCYSTGMRKITSKSNTIQNSTIYFMMQQDYIQSLINQYAEGTTILHASKSIDHLYLTFNENLLDKFELITSEMYERILINSNEIDFLQQTRDTLLPKLLSGELDVSELDIGNINE